VAVTRTYDAAVLAELVDLDRYPVTDLDSPAARAVVAEHQAALRERGVSVLPGFVRAGAVEAMVAECDALAASSRSSEAKTMSTATPSAPSSRA
jgi:hypothetical protein